MTSPALTPVLICEAHYQNGQCAGSTISVPAPQPNAIAELGAPALLGGAAYAAAVVFGAPSWLKFGGAALAALLALGAVTEIEKKKVAAGIARQLAAGICLGQSPWYQYQQSHFSSGTNPFLTMPNDVLAKCGFIPSEFATVRNQLAAIQSGDNTAQAATDASNEKTFAAAAAALFSAAGL